VRSVFGNKNRLLVHIWSCYIRISHFRNHDIINQHSALKHKNLVSLNNFINNCKSKTQFLHENRKEHHWEHLWIRICYSCRLPLLWLTTEIRFPCTTSSCIWVMSHFVPVLRIISDNMSVAKLSTKITEATLVHERHVEQFVRHNNYFIKAD